MLGHPQPRCRSLQCSRLADASVDMAATRASLLLNQPRAVRGDAAAGWVQLAPGGGFINCQSCVHGMTGLLDFFTQYFAVRSLLARDASYAMHPYGR